MGGKWETPKREKSRREHRAPWVSKGPQGDSYPVVFPVSHDDSGSEGAGGVHAGARVIDLQGEESSVRPGRNRPPSVGDRPPFAALAEDRHAARCPSTFSRRSW